MMGSQKRSQGKIHPEMLVGISAVVIGLCALGVSLYETSLMRAEQRSGVLPILELGRSYNVSDTDPSRNRLSLIAQNVGIGPARILDFTVTIDGKHYPTWDAAMRTLAGSESRVSYSMSTINGRTIPPDKTIEMFNLSDLSHLEPILENFERLDFEACYCSVFDECWTTKMSTFGAAVPVEGCRSTEQSFKE
ncbi:MAG: hypothetical protein AAFN78_05725 [Pseudomonadota bacterium]